MGGVADRVVGGVIASGEVFGETDGRNGDRCMYAPFDSRSRGTRLARTGFPFRSFRRFRYHRDLGDSAVALVSRSLTSPAHPRHAEGALT